MVGTALFSWSNSSVGSSLERSSLAVKYLFSSEFVHGLIQDPEYFVPILIIALLVIIPIMVGLILLGIELLNILRKLPLRKRKVYIGLGLVFFGIIIALVPVRV